MRLILFLVSLFSLLAGGRIDSFAGQTNRIGHATFLVKVNKVAGVSAGLATRLHGATGLHGATASQGPIKSKGATTLQGAATLQGATTLQSVAMLPGAPLLPEISRDLASVVATNIPEHKRIDICEDSETEDDREVFARKLKIVSGFLISEFTPAATNVSQYYRSSATAPHAAPIYLLLGVLRL